LNFRALHLSVSYGSCERIQRIERIKLIRYTHSAHTRSCSIRLLRTEPPAVDCRRRIGQSEVDAQRVPLTSTAQRSTQCAGDRTRRAASSKSMTVRMSLAGDVGGCCAHAAAARQPSPALYRALSDNRQRARPRLRFVRPHQRHGLSVAQQSRLGNLKSSRLRRELLLVLTGWTHRLAWTLAPPLGP
jgi:hypothetical protein